MKVLCVKQTITDVTSYLIAYHFCKSISKSNNRMTCRNTHFQKETENLTCDRNVTLTKRGNIIGNDF